MKNNMDKVDNVIEILRISLSQGITPKKADELVKIAIKMLEDLDKE